MSKGSKPARKRKWNQSILRNVKDALKNDGRIDFDEISAIIDAEVTESNGLSQKEINDLLFLYKRHKNKFTETAYLCLGAFLSRATKQKYREVFVVDYHDPEDGATAIRFLRNQGCLVQRVTAFNVPQAVLDILYNFEQRKKRMKTVRVLRFYGHGTGDLMVVGGGASGYPDDAELEHATTIRVTRRGGNEVLTHSATLSLLKQVLDPRVSHCELHGCDVGKQGEDSRLPVLLAKVLNVPVVVGMSSQFTSTYAPGNFEAISTDLFFEGKVAVGRPGKTKAAIVKRPYF